MQAKIYIPVITIDGPSASGKGTLCRLLAQQLGWHMLDSGATYRLLALLALRYNLELNDDVALAALTKKMHICFDLQTNGELRILLDDMDVTLQLRTEQSAEIASQIATLPAVRYAMLAKQRAFCQAPGLVSDGRDLGTVVFPHANLKIFLTASAQERAKRRYKQLKEKGVNVTLEQILNELKTRDARDSGRDVAPLIPAADSVLLDSSELTSQAVLAKAMALVRACGLMKLGVL